MSHTLIKCPECNNEHMIEVEEISSYFMCDVCKANSAFENLRKKIDSEDFSKMLKIASESVRGK